jgi:hypothetical protein
VLLDDPPALFLVGDERVEDVLDGIDVDLETGGENDARFAEDGELALDAVRVTNGVPALR